MCMYIYVYAYIINLFFLIKFIPQWKCKVIKSRRKFLGQSLRLLLFEQLQNRPIFYSMNDNSVLRKMCLNERLLIF